MILHNANAKNNGRIPIIPIDPETTTMIYVTHRADELPKSITNALTLKK